MTSKNENVNFGFMHIKQKIGIQVAGATNTVFDLLMTSNDLNDLQKGKNFNYGLDGQTLDSLMLLYSLGSYLLCDMHKAIVKTFSFLEVI